MKDELDRAKYPRMPWHDVQCALYGPSCRDVARHFVQRWNYAKVSYIQWSAHRRKNLSYCIYKLTVLFPSQRNKALNEQAIPLLMPHHHMVIPHYKGRSKETNERADGKQCHDKDIDVRKPVSTSRASCQDVPLLLPQELEPQELSSGDVQVTDLDINHLDHLNKKSFNQPLLNRKAKLDSSHQDLPMRSFVDNIRSLDEPSVRNDRHYMDNRWWEMQERGDQVASVLDVGQVGPRVTCRCQVSTWYFVASSFFCLF
jgi:phospholipase D1/2